MQNIERPRACDSVRGAVQKSACAHPSGVNVYSFWAAFRGEEDEPQSGDEDEGEEEREDGEDLGDLEDPQSPKMIAALKNMLIGTFERCERAMQKRLAACKDPTLRLQATRTGWNRLG